MISPSVTPPMRHIGGRCCRWSAGTWTSQFRRNGGQRAPSAQIVAIGAADSIDADLLEKTSASCLLPAAANT